MAEGRPTPRQRRAVEERASRCCEYCLSQAKYGTQSFSVEHIYPLAKGGETRLDNLAFSCQGCNGYKSDKITAPDPITKIGVALYNPRQDAWKEHFRWSDDFLTIIGLTPTGRATVKLLRINREEVVNLREVLYLTGRHPPQLSR